MLTGRSVVGQKTGRKRDTVNSQWKGRENGVNPISKPGLTQYFRPELADQEGVAGER